MTESPSPPLPDDDAFLAQLGQRVRRIRSIRGMSRKHLAQVSDISERYIAQLESGRGNVSIVLLRRIAAAMGVALEQLIGDGHDGAEWAALRDLLREAPPSMVEDVKALLRGEPRLHDIRGHRNIPGDRVALIGMRGAGKSTLGRIAAERLGWQFVEINREIERENGFSVSEIFSLYGQDGYRRLELAALRNIASRPGSMILTTGGGVVAEPAAFDLLLSSFLTIWIKASPDEHMARVRQQGDLRPMGNDRAAMAELIAILSSREPLYAKAIAVVDTSGTTVEVAADALIATIKSHAELRPKVALSRLT
jgi:XRE family aerobic/anaerobic benzoate catabolism transcriptional regulator